MFNPQRYRLASDPNGGFVGTVIAAAGAGETARGARLPHARANAVAAVKTRRRLGRAERCEAEFVIIDCPVFGTGSLEYEDKESISLNIR